MPKLMTNHPARSVQILQLWPFQMNAVGNGRQKMTLLDIIEMFMCQFFLQVPQVSNEVLCQTVCNVSAMQVQDANLSSHSINAYHN